MPEHDGLKRRSFFITELDERRSRCMAGMTSMLDTTQSAGKVREDHRLLSRTCTPVTVLPE